MKLSHKESDALRIIRNYLVHMNRTPTVRELTKGLGYKSPNSAAIVINGLIESGILARNSEKKLQLKQRASRIEGHIHTVEVPLVGTVACGTPILAEENIEAFFPVSTELARPPYQYFLLRTKGNSMDQKGIHDGDIVLVREKSTADEGDIIVALIDDEATIKEFHRSGDTFFLMPRSSDDHHKPIILSNDFRVQGVVIKTIQGL
ncbi:MAG: transcriptional repressor LexA [Methylococcales bacterium]|nr:transcriptional repressor LexA [Methylococcales bacterium]